MSNITNILLRHNYVQLPSDADGKAGDEALATILMNLSYYGYALSLDAYQIVSKLASKDLAAWWTPLEAELKDMTGAGRKIGDFVVYKNFPAEVLDKTLAEYWLPQILMYWGFPKEIFAQDVKPREKMSEQPKAIVLKHAKKDTLKAIFESYLKSSARWKKQELEDVLYLSESLPVNLGKLAFKENLVQLAATMMDRGRKISLSTGTDVLRLAAGLSDGDVSLREKVKFKSFKKPVRRFLLSMLEDCKNLKDDVARRPELFKRLIHTLHPFDYRKQFPWVCKVANELYRGEIHTFNGRVEPLLAAKDPAVLDILSDRPGDFRRRLVHTLDLFGGKAVKSFTGVIDQLTVAQIVSLRSYLDTVNSREHRTFPPKGNWTKLQIGKVRKVDEKYVKSLSKALGKVLADRIPAVQSLDDAAKMIKLPSNDGEVSPYNRGTVFPIPSDVEFIRTASYWQNPPKGGVTWFDNGWNFFDQEWKSLGACCWNSVQFPGGGYPHLSNKKMSTAGAVFSGDPINTGEMKGRAAQLIDLYPAKLREAGVRYAVWNILCYSRIAFSAAEDVFAALQWGKDPGSGKLFEPSRCQLQLPLKGDSMTKYVCVLDLESMEMTYIDANLHGQVQAASQNGSSLEKNMPPFMEYIRSLPSVHDLFRESVDKKSDGARILYSDKDTELNSGSAYVFKPENKENKYKPVDINGLLG